MLYGYPVEATADNWLHDCLCELLRSVHASLQAQEALQPWPDIIPEVHRPKLTARIGLRDRLDAYVEALRRANLLSRTRALKALEDQNRIASLLSCMSECEALKDLPKPIQKPLKELFVFAFDLLTPLGIRDRHYKTIYDAGPHVCPFCGCELFDAPGGPHEALDHYLAESKYPFAAANLQNLVPMGNKCNSRYKLAQDILRRADGTRRKSFYPYNHEGIKISLDNSQPFAGTDEQKPLWQIDFDRDIEEAATWDEVFHIRERYQRDVLDPSFNSWLREFSSWYRCASFTFTSDQELIDVLERYTDYLEIFGIRDQAFLKKAVFRMLYKHCQQGNQRLIKLISNLVQT